jgi:hypothetical protein
VVGTAGTDVQMFPDRSALVQVLQQLGLSSILPTPGLGALPARA